MASVNDCYGEIAHYPSVSLKRTNSRRSLRRTFPVPVTRKRSRHNKEKDTLCGEENSDYPWYIGECSKQEAEDILKEERKDGCFIVRKEQQQIILSVYIKLKGMQISKHKKRKGKIRHVAIEDIDLQNSTHSHSIGKNELQKISELIQDLKHHGDRQAHIRRKLSRPPNVELLRKLHEQSRSKSSDSGFQAFDMEQGGDPLTDMKQTVVEAGGVTSTCFPQFLTHIGRKLSSPHNLAELLCALHLQSTFELSDSGSLIDVKSAGINQVSFSLPTKGIFSFFTADWKGSSTEVPNTGVTIVIPRGAVKQGQTLQIYIGVSWEERDRISWTNYGRKVSPTIVCGPPESKFDIPVIISFPHCIRSNGRKMNHLTVLKSESGIGERNRWEEAPIIDPKKEMDPSRDIYANVLNERCVIFTRHFTKFSCACDLLKEPHEYMALRVLAYHNVPIMGEDVKIRVYVGDNNPDNEAFTDKEERKLGGQQSDARQLIRLHDIKKDVNVVVNRISEGWDCVGSKDKVISFYSLWSDDAIQSTSFLLEPKDEKLSKCRCMINVCQGPFKKEREAEINVSIMLKQQDGCGNNEQSLKSKLLTGDHELTQRVCEAMPISSDFEVNGETQVELMKLLDPPHPTFNDWRMLAGKLGLTSSTIAYLETQKSPTSSLLHVFCARKIPVKHWCAKLREMGRLDAVHVLEKRRTDCKGNVTETDLITFADEDDPLT